MNILKFNWLVLLASMVFNVQGQEMTPSRITKSSEEKMNANEDKVKLAPTPISDERIFGLVSLSVANLRTNPSHKAELSTQALLGTPLNILDKKEGWLLVETPDNYVAWTEENGIELLNTNLINSWLQARKLVYYKLHGNTYEKPDTKSQTISDAVICDVFEYDGETKHFYKIRYPDKRMAYVLKSDCISFESWCTQKKPTAEEIIQTAKQFMGIPYLWGGTSSKGVDCSGFTKLTFLIHGIILHRDATQQANFGNTIEQENKNGNNQSPLLSRLHPANLLFFGEKEPSTNKEKVTHVGLYIGNGEFIHASGKVQINSFDSKSAVYSEYRKNSLIKAADYIGSIDTTNITSIRNNNFYCLHK